MHGSYDPKRTALILFPICIVLCVGLGIYVLFSELGILGAICFFSAAALMTLPIIAARNRRIELRDDGFVYRTWLGRAYEYKYSDVEWYDDSGYDPVLHIRDRKLFVDCDSQEWPEINKRLQALGAPSCDPAKAVLSPENGEEAAKVLRLYGRVPVAAYMLILAVITAALPVLLLVFNNEDAGLWDTVCKILLTAGFAFCVLVFINLALVYLISRIELYSESFVYVDPIGRRREYAFSDAVSCKHIKPGRYGSFDNPGFRLIMNDGRKIMVDLKMLNNGLGEKIGFDRIRDCLKKEL